MTATTFSNSTLYSISSNTSRHIWAVFFIFVLLSSLVGDTTILISSIRYRAMRLHKVVVVIIQHIAVCDLLVSLFSTSVLPRAVTLIAGGWELGTPLCYVMVYNAYYFVPVGNLLICAMTASKLFILMFPFRASSLRVKYAHAVCAGIWASVLIIPATNLVSDHDDVVFNYRTCVCDWGYTSEAWYWLRPLFATIFVFLPSVFVVATTVALLVVARKIARRGQENLKWQGITTTVLVAVVYCVSVLPYSIYHFAASSVKDQSGFLHNDFSRIAESFLCLNTISNFYIYSLTVSSFRRFLWSRMQLLVHFLCRTTPNIAVVSRVRSTPNIAVVYRSRSTPNIHEVGRRRPRGLYKQNSVYRRV